MSCNKCLDTEKRLRNKFHAVENQNKVFYSRIKHFNELTLCQHLLFVLSGKTI